MKYTAIDFETANSSPLSACSIGVVVFEDGVPVRETVTLIRPPQEYGKFNWYNVRIHGIKAPMVAKAPTFDEVWETLRADIEGGLIVCHNAMFDTAVLCKLLDYYHIPMPEFSYVCTVKISQKIWPEMENHKLDTVSEELGIRLDHHQALSDARACGLILARAMQELHCTDIESLAEKIAMRVGHVGKEGKISCSTAEEIRRKIESQKKKEISRRRYYAYRQAKAAAKAAATACDAAKQGGNK
ncbi:MAG: 3'-5' exonuclease [Butyricicoccus sp.]